MDQAHHACRDCGAVGTTCCATAQARRETCNSLEFLVRRQSNTITNLQRELYDATQVANDLRAKGA